MAGPNGLYSTKAIENMLRAGIDPTSWDTVGGPASIKLLVDPNGDTVFAITQHPGAHDEDRGILAELRAGASRQLMQQGCNRAKPRFQVQPANTLFCGPLCRRFHGRVSCWFGPRIRGRANEVCGEQYLPRAYFVTDLAGPSGSYSTGDIDNAIKQIDPTVWDVAGGPASLQLLVDRNRNPVLVISADSGLHDRIAVLEELRAGHEGNVSQ